MSKLLLVFSLLGLWSACVAQVVQTGQCNDLPVAENFKIEDFLGTWYELSRTENPNQPGDCAYYRLTNDSNVLNVYHSSVNKNFLEVANGTVSQVDNTAKLSLAISSFENPIDFWVLQMNVMVAITYSCENITPTQRRIHLWALARERAITEAAWALINSALTTTFSIDPSTLRRIDHSADACLILPIIEPGNPIVLHGQCDPTLPVLQNFNVARFLGVWHQISSYETANSAGTCVRAEYSLGNGVVDVLNSQIINQQLLTIDGNASVSSTDNSAKLSVVLNIPGAPAVTQNLWILASDYETYAISYTCVNISSTEKQVFSWILSRSRQIPPSSQAEVNKVVDSYLDLNYQYYKQTNQSNAGCFFYPEPVPNKPVVFRGQCESANVQAMPNFNAGAYMGLWHNIELYPAPFQDGTCSNAFYEIVDGSVAVLNTQVINQRLDTINAVAVVASTDGSAKLVVTFPVAGTNLTVSTDYWVLDTDYSNYALVYTCFNIDADNMQVGGWKLSRTKQLTPASQIAINTEMSKVLYLDQRYFETMSQTEESCFYFPEAQPGVPVVFPGQCDQNIDYEQNFDFALFQGTWYEVQAYPKAEQTGQCINHRYTFVNTALLNLVSSSVTDQFLGVTTGLVTRPNPDSGNLTISITGVNGEAINIPFVVLRTDYSDYALAYACVNLNQDFRGVWSWKLSRRKQLSAAANTTIDNIIENNVVLNNAYFETIDQSDQACFYLPELEPGEPVILPGQCSATITGIPNFNVARYAGRWRLIESYGSNFQVGTCNVARYTLRADNTVEVTNSQVVNQELVTTTGTATVASTDGSGLLTVYFPSSNNFFNLTILDTDYESYALVYGCVNMVNNQMRVYSWKLSRENTLSTVAINKMDEIISGIQVLNNRFYYSVNRTDTGCFYFPTPDPNSGVRFRGQCSQSIPVVTGFQAARYLGVWYDIESYPEDFQDGTCNTAVYSPGNDVDVYNTQVINEALFSINGSAVLEFSADGSAKLRVTFNVGGVDVTTNYWVLATDYESYSLVYSCRPYDDEYVQVTSWKLSRWRTLTPAAATAINSAMSNINVVDQRYFLARNQTPEGCFYFPEPQPGVQVVFPGQCDDSIAAVPNFNMAAFQGTWYEIEAYPKDDQNGQCITHQYTPGVTNTLNLQSSNVLNQVLSLTSSTVRFNSTDGSGRLIINITSNTDEIIEIPFWILSTDYTNYALAYTCVNINNETRGVFSWKLSRSKQLSQENSTAINNAMTNINVLDNKYFEDINQSDQACFHLPEIKPGDDVILPGQCDSTIRGIANFDLTRYAGEWRLIESYGSRFQSGTCNVASYTLQTSNTLNVTNSQVVDVGLASIAGTATVSSTDGSGQLIFNFPSSNTQYQLYILDTDYESYSLAYSCENRPNNQRRVRSWKFSRSNTLSQNATNSINQVMNTIDVLHQPYYYIVNRTSDGCFYFPEPDRNTTVRFRGQCDESIPVVTNFDVGRYLGLWHDVESYPMAFQDGECPNAFYAPFNSTTVTVYNTHVIDQSLGVINGLATASPDGSAKLKVTFNVQNINVTTNYWILDTDYNTFALVYSCVNLNNDYMSISSWKLSRTKALTPVAQNRINNAMNNIRVLDQRYYINRDLTPEGCFYFPEPQPGVQVVFPGQCNNSIAAVANFNMTAFQGTWYETAAYPKDDQPGQCVSQQFRVNGTNSMHLDSFNVLNQAQSATEGHVTFADTDGSGKLFINIWVDGEAIQIPFWILSTDYTDYALAYSCVNINSDYRGVWSWKLSKTRQLSALGNVAINNAIANIDVLDNKYYEDIQQSDSACFYYPELGPSDPVIFPGQCDPNIPVVQNFNASAYLGQWRLIESYFSDFQEGTCNTATYSAAADGSVIVFNTEVTNEQLSNITGSAVLASNDGSGKLLVTFPNAPPVEYWILDTVYDSYALIYSCVNINSDQRRVFSWKMSRTNTLTEKAIDSINKIVNSVDILDARYYQIVNRSETGCFYYPTPDSSSSVIFPGQCDESIPVVPNFNPSMYLGTWYDIQSYPTNFQSGTCNTATYSLNPDGTIAVRNTEVVDQVLQTMIGSAVPATTDGSAKLNVTFPLSSGDATTNYWVLATDYLSYSFVYSCRNIDAETRTVYSWKLSRTRSLPAAAEIAINNVANTVQVLRQQYFVQRSHTEEACFYYPNNNGGDVILNGQCVPDALVPAITNFNANLFAGTWHEVARFPSTLQNGECTSTQYALDGNNFNVIQTSVIEEALLNTTTQAQVSTDGRGVISVNVFGVPFKDVYILDTDYREYAVAYSCRNLNANTKQIYSWKLSRSRAGLSDAANNAIDQIVSDNIDLFEYYYRYTSQDYAACFYYPVFDQLPATIELPGPCNTSISAVLNFNAVAYLGTWYEVARYPQNAQSGQCNRAEYGNLGGGVVSVVNSQVIDETLATMTGEARVASTDGSGLLNVTFVVGGEPRYSNYYVLATDYSNYSLVYSCADLSNGNRRVGSWKLSRTPTLSSQALTVIDEVVNKTQGLSQDYYQPTSQSDESCFYYPVFDQLPPTVELPGPCNTSIKAVPNFDAVAYLGTWYEVARYPQNAQSGQCNRAEYGNPGDGVVSVVNSQVIDETLATMTGEATVASTDGSGLLNVTFVVGGEPRYSNYYVLATDYSNYSLVYSCADLSNGNRRVGSWKLSRTPTLSLQALTVIDEVVNKTQGLSQDYYQPTSQSDESCFYYPVFDQLPPTVELPGPCNTSIKAVPNFDAVAYLGTWYEVARYPQNAQSGQCNRAEYGNLGGGVVSVVNSQVVDETLATMTGEATVASTDGSGLLNVTFVVGGEPRYSNYYVLATDYSNYSLVYSCADLSNGNRRVGSWKLSRTPTLSSQALTVIDEVVNKTQGLSQDYYQPTSQSDESCFYYPVFDQLPPTVELPGPCNTSIKAVPNFDAVAYLGTWYEVARYPQNAQSGQCNRAEYGNLGGGVVSVVNSQVVDETLATMTGEATVASTDGSGLLNVTFVVGGQTRYSNYYVLATDYSNYSLVYSCADLPNGNRRVGSWKLSRTPTLSSQALAVIDEVVNKTQGLSQDYYQPTSQSDESCFYYPVFDQLPPAIELPGPCNTSIKAVPNFDAVAYLGTWYEVARYPQRTQSGQCNRAEYGDLGGGLVSVVNSQVINETLATRPGEARLASTDGSGLLEVTFVVGGETRRSNYYVLATNYKDYSLVYSCANLPNGDRRVGSWKLSRTPTLSSPTFNAVIDEVINKTQGLSQDYYQPTSQSDESCFHYPTQTGAHVILPGQCDENIPVVQSFEVDEFNGTWYQIQRYDAVDNSTCIGVRSTFNAASDTFNVIAFEVVDGELLTTEGSGRLNSTDGSGKLSLVMPVAGTNVTKEIYVLATDYANYALAYSCENINSSHRRVGAWQLSRGRTMEDASVTAINLIIEQRPELHHPYFKQISHEGDCPEPSSAFLFKSSIIVIFVCALLQLVW